MKSEIIRLIQLIVLLATFIIPTFWLANKVSGDEYIKTVPGVILAAIIAIWHLWSGKKKSDE